jgi:hypothetical protein
MVSDKKPEKPKEKEAVYTTIVGGRPPGCGTQVGNIPRGIEVLDSTWNITHLRSTWNRSTREKSIY